MPYVHLNPAGDILALTPQAEPGSVFLPSSDARVLRLLFDDDPDSAQHLLVASDALQRFLLDSLLRALAESKGLLPPKTEPAGPSQVAALPTRLRTLQERVEDDDEAVLHSLNESDQGAVRLIEDVIDLLEQKGLLRREELPRAAQTLLRLRRELRAYLSDDSADEIEPG